MHATMNVYNAFCDRVPVIVLAGNDLDAAHRSPGVPTVHSAQDINAIVRDYTKWDDTPVSAQHFAQSFVRAYQIATTPPYAPVVISLDDGLATGADPGLRPEALHSEIRADGAAGGRAGAVREAARLLVNAEHPVIVADRAVNTEKGIALLVQLAELLQAPVVRQRGRLNFPNTHYLSRPATVIPQADVILGLELTDYWETVNKFVDNNDEGVGTNSSRIKPDTKLISISTLQLMTKSNYQEFQRFQSVDVPMPGDVEATLPSLIEAVKSALTDDRKNAMAKRGEAIRKDHDKGRDGTKQAAAIAWDASPITTARLCMEIYAQIKDLDWSLVSSSGDVSGWPLRLWPMDKHYHWTGTSGGYGVGWGASGFGRRGARQPRRGPLLGLDPVRRRSDVCAGRAVDRGAAQDSDAGGDAQQPRLSPGGDARAAAVQLPQPRRQYRQRSGPDRHQHHESGHRVSQARRIHGLVGQGADQGSGRSRAGDQGSGRRGQIRPAGAGQRLDAAAVRRLSNEFRSRLSGCRRCSPPA